MDVVLATDRARVAQPRRGLVDGTHHVLLRLGCRQRGAHAAQRLGGEHGAGERAKILGRDLAIRDLAQVFVDVAGVDLAARALFVEVLEQLLSGQLLAALHDPRDAAVGDTYTDRDAALAAELEDQLGAMNLHVPAAQRGEAVGLVGFRVLVRADPDQGALEQPHDGGHDLLARQAGPPDVELDALANLPQHLAEREHAVELRFVALRSEFRVVAVLLAAARVPRGYLQVSVRMRADPHARPGGRNRQRADALQGGFIPDGPPVGTGIGEALALALARDPRHRVRDIAQPGRLRGNHVLVGEGLCHIVGLCHGRGEATEKGNL
jgi:hypothetical protein